MRNSLFLTYMVWKHNEDVELEDKMKDSHERMNENVMEE